MENPCNIKIPSWFLTKEFMHPLFYWSRDVPDMLKEVKYEKTPYFKLLKQLFCNDCYPGGYYGLILNCVYTNIRIH